MATIGYWEDLLIIKRSGVDSIVRGHNTGFNNGNRSDLIEFLQIKINQTKIINNNVSEEVVLEIKIA